MTQAKQQRTPRGVILIASLLIIGVFFVGGLGALVPTQTLEEFNLPRSLMLIGALVYGLLAYGLLRTRRWAWASMLSFVFVHTYFIVLSSRIDGSLQFVGLGLLAGIAVYLLLPKVRSHFLHRT